MSIRASMTFHNNWHWIYIYISKGLGYMITQIGIWSVINSSYSFHGDKDNVMSKKGKHIPINGSYWSVYIYIYI